MGSSSKHLKTSHSTSTITLDNAPISDLRNYSVKEGSKVDSRLLPGIIGWVRTSFCTQGGKLIVSLVLHSLPRQGLWVQAHLVSLGGIRDSSVILQKLSVRSPWVFAQGCWLGHCQMAGGQEECQRKQEMQAKCSCEEEVADSGCFEQQGQAWAG